MTVFLGSEGYVELKRARSLQDFESVIKAADVSEERDRFSFEYPDGMLITGDRIEFVATDGNPLTFVDPSGWNVNQQQSAGDWFVHVDVLGGLRLYHSFAAAVNADSSEPIPLLEPGRDIPVTVRPVTSNGKCLAKVQSYEFNSTREAVDISVLSDQFREQYSQLISGSGSLNCIFSYRKELCEDTDQPTEHAVYLHQLCTRQRLGAKFHAKLFLARPGTSTGAAADDSVWYEFDALVTNAAIAVEPTQLITSTIEFVTTGDIRLKVSTMPSSYVLQEDRAFVLLDQDVTSRLELDTD